MFLYLVVTMLSLPKFTKKPTHTERYLPYFSHHPKHQKLAITLTLHNIISSYITDSMERQEARKDVCPNPTNKWLSLQVLLPTATQTSSRIALLYKVYFTPLCTRHHGKDTKNSEWSWHESRNKACLRYWPIPSFTQRSYFPR